MEKVNIKELKKDLYHLLKKHGSDIDKPIETLVLGVCYKSDMKGSYEGKTYLEGNIQSLAVLVSKIGNELKEELEGDRIKKEEQEKKKQPRKFLFFKNN